MRAIGKIASMVSALLLVGAAGAAVQPAQAATPPTWWIPGPNTTWQWQITGKVDTTVTPATMFDIDMQDAVPTATTIPVPGFGSGSVTWPKGQNAGVINTLHSMRKIVICYTDGGAWEDYRSDAKLFPSSVLGNSTGWSGERWMDIRRAAWPRFAPIIWARMTLAKTLGCDGVEIDQNNPIGNNPGFPITVADQKAWYLEVATQAHNRNLSVGQKNGIETTDADTVAAFDWDLNEECFQYKECDVLKPYISANKAVFQVEYRGTVSKTSGFCPKATAMKFSSMKKKLSLGAYREVCPTTP